ncbi:MAG: zf-TFIIB domain-containing protein [Methylococcaceae bacterium]
MAQCTQCSAPLPANSNKCVYCGTRNDVDLNNKQYILIQEDSNQLCPRCNTHLQIIDLNLNGAFLVARCPTCFGLFFENGQIENLLESSVGHVSLINLQHLDNINKDRYYNDEVKYLKCPVCQVLMNRVNYGQRSGVIVDKCMRHGVWLDCGEITHLMEWKQAGGQLLDAQVKANPPKPDYKPKSIEDYELPFARYDDEDSPNLLQAIINVLIKPIE